MALTTNLVAYYKLDESSGNATDTVGGFTLTNNNTVGYATGKINNGADFGTANANKCLSISNTLGITGGSCSFGGWVKMRTEIASGQQVIWIQSSTTNNDSYYVLYDYNAGTRRLQFVRSRLGAAADTLIYTITLGTSNFYHIGMTYDGATVTGYVNGVSVGTVASSGNGASGGSDRFVIGADRDLTSTPLSAYVDEVGVWSRAITASEVSQLYNGNNGSQYDFSSVATYMDAVSGAALNATSNPTTWSHTCLGIKRALFVSVIGPPDSGAFGTVTVTYNGVALTKIGSEVAVDNSTVDWYISLWYLIAPATGSNTVSVSTSYSGGGSGPCAAISYAGVLQSGIPDSTAGANSAGAGVTSKTFTTTVVAATCWTILAFRPMAATDWVAGAGTVLRKSSPGGNGTTLFDSNGIVGTGAQSLIATGSSDKVGGVIASFATVLTSSTNASFLLNFI